MRKIELKEDVKLMGYRTLRKGERFDVDRDNSRYVYIKENGLTIQLPRKAVEKVY